jgi:actin-related protein
VVLDCGDGVTHVVPVCEGFALTHATQRMDLAGRDITENMMLQLRRHGHVFHTSAEQEIVSPFLYRTIFMLCFRCGIIVASSWNFAVVSEKKLRQVREMKERVCYVAYNPQKEETNVATDSSIPKTYKLPDGQVINLGAERFRAPEILFQPALVGMEHKGVHGLLDDSISSTV